MNRPTASPLHGKRVLILEDDYYLATDLAAAMTRSGATVAGPFAGVPEAVAEIDRTSPSVALVDVNLGAGPDFDLPRLLLARGIPFAFLTGYDASAIPAVFEHVPRLEKPVATGAAIAVATALAGAG